uniref:Ig-like domain-containing protein n=1 Tax=Cyanistes caeruleus TaxID=156563 RepID=A0A8C0ZG76_CYACU
MQKTTLLTALHSHAPFQTTQQRDYHQCAVRGQVPSGGRTKKPIFTPIYQQPSFDDTVIHWYKQKEGEAPQRLLFVSGACPGPFVCHPVLQTAVSVKDCTRVRIYVVFGSGTKLFVSGKFFHSLISPPANSEILQKKHENQITYVCLIEKFYPEVIRVTWTEDKKEITDNVVKGDTWLSRKEDEYSIASWLTVPAENEDKKYYCKYEHEKEKASLSTQGIFHMLKM